MLVSAVQQHEPAICIHILPLSWDSLQTPIPPTWVIKEQQAELPVPYTSFPLAIYFTHGSAYMSMLLFQFIPPSPSYPTHVHKFILYVCISIPAPQIGSSIPFF